MSDNSSIMKQELVVGWRILCVDCGVNCDLHACYNDSDDECNHEFLLCSECIKKRQEESANE
jgi:hypothetical protein